MAATFTFNEYNGNMQGSAGYYGTTLQTNITTCNWKNIDDATTGLKESILSDAFEKSRSLILSLI